MRAGLGRSEYEGQKRMLELHEGSTSKLEICPNLWAGVGLVRGGAGTALVGSHAEVAERIEEYHALGIDEFVLAGHPHLEEAYWFGEGVLPILERKGPWRPRIAPRLNRRRPASPSLEPRAGRPEPHARDRVRPWLWARASRCGRV